MTPQFFKTIKEWLFPVRTEDDVLFAFGFHVWISGSGYIPLTCCVMKRFWDNFALGYDIRDTCSIPGCKNPVMKFMGDSIQQCSFKHVRLEQEERGNYNNALYIPENCTKCGAFLPRKKTRPCTNCGDPQ